LKLENSVEWKRMWVKIKLMIISSLSSQVQIMVDNKKLENVVYFN